MRNRRACPTQEITNQFIVPAAALRAKRDNVADGTSHTLCNQVGVFLASVLLTPMRPRGSADVHVERRTNLMTTSALIYYDAS
jgi:hypothetical protein